MGWNNYARPCIPWDHACIHVLCGRIDLNHLFWSFLGLCEQIRLNDRAIFWLLSPAHLLFNQDRHFNFPNHSTKHHQYLNQYSELRRFKNCLTWVRSSQKEIGASPVASALYENYGQLHWLTSDHQTRKIKLGFCSKLINFGALLK